MRDFPADNKPKSINANTFSSLTAWDQQNIIDIGR